MREEISAAVVFLARLIKKSTDINDNDLEDFKNRVSELLVKKFKNHWFPNTPDKGQGYRCIRVNGVSRRDSTLEQAAILIGKRYEDLNLPAELTLWVDPMEVCCRFGENKGSFCTLATFHVRDQPEINEGSDVSSNDDSSRENDSYSFPMTHVQPSNQSQAQDSKTKRSGQQQQNGRGPNSSQRGREHLYPQLPLNAWYRLLSPPWAKWVPPSSPPYSQPSYHHKTPHHRYGSPPKQQTLKV